MKVALVRVGIDSGSGGIQGPLFRDGSFEFIPIPDPGGRDERTYGNTRGRYDQRLIDCFPPSRRERMRDQSMHVDPEFATFTYGDPTTPKSGLKHLENGDLLVFFCGLQGFDFESPPTLYLMGYFEVSRAGLATDFTEEETRMLFAANFHVRHKNVYDRQRDHLVLVKGGKGSRLLNKAVCISATGLNRASKPIKIVSPEMQQIFGDFDGKLSIQRSPTRWVKPEFVETAAAFVRGLD